VVRWLPWLLVPFLAASVMSCGSSRRLDQPARVQSPRDLLVTEQQIDAVGRGTPAGVVLRWWQALQYRDLPEAKAAYSRDVDLGGFIGTTRKGGQLEALPNLTRSLGGASVRQAAVELSSLVTRSRPVPLEETQTGDTARVLTVIQSATFTKKGRPRVSEVPLAVRLVREDGRWKLADNDYLNEALAAKRAAGRLQRAQRAQGATTAGATTAGATTTGTTTNASTTGGVTTTPRIQPSTTAGGTSTIPTPASP
jgi:hypothetical protein